MSYKVHFYSQPREFLKKVDKHIARRIQKKFESIQEHPFHYLEHFSGEDVYKLRIGEYRALIDVENNVLNVQFIEHRKRIYKRFKT